MLPVETVALVDVDDDAISRLQGNASRVLKRWILQYFTLGAYHNETYASAQGSRLRPVSLSLAPTAAEEGRMEARMTCTIRVEEDMVDESGNLATGFLAYLLDICSTYPILAHAITGGRKDDFFGVTHCLQMVFHNPAPLGTELRIESASVATGGRSLVARSEIWDATRNQRICSGVHMKMSMSFGKL
ncbi:hypothetical protein EXIGLDRAFT_734618 [Exidia glandulosa HHB12029]|uniref:Thioesterase domain-containing protein n=1 Tax=Exidia glandulosa HHB12029 TaxID=1314781 RepID=A0A165PPZ6_EXIGL|nr:hypothetical protein EXIGLDRAFT_734618 [Exidia glandulosa HHB12029]